MDHSFSSTVLVSDQLNLTDFIVFFILIFGTLLFMAIKNINGRKIKNRDENSAVEYLLMGRRLSLPLFVGTLVASWYGGIFGVTQIAFEKGIYNFITQGVFWYVTYIIFAFVLVDRVRKGNAITLPDLIGQMYGPHSKKIAAIFNFFNLVPVVYALSLGMVLKSCFGGSLAINTLFGLSVVAFYSAWGGFSSIVWTDLIQFICMCLGVLSVIFFSYQTFGGISFLKSNLPDAHFSLTGGEPIQNLLIWGFIALSTLVDPNFYQRCFAAKSSQLAKKGILISTLIWICIDLCTTFGGMYAKAVISQANSNESYMVYALQLLPHGFKGLFMASVVSIIISTLDSYLFLGGSTLSYDLKLFRFKKIIHSHWTGIVVVAITAFILSILFDGNIRLIWKTMGGLSSSSFLIPVFMGQIFKLKLSDKQFCQTCLFSAMANIGAHFTNVRTWLIPDLDIDPFYFGVIVSLFLIFYFNYFSTYFSKKVSIVLKSS